MTAKCPSGTIRCHGRGASVSEIDATTTISRCFIMQLHFMLHNMSSSRQWIFFCVAIIAISIILPLKPCRGQFKSDPKIFVLPFAIVTLGRVIVIKSFLQKIHDRDCDDNSISASVQFWISKCLFSK